MDSALPRPTRREGPPLRFGSGVRSSILKDPRPPATANANR